MIEQRLIFVPLGLQEEVLRGTSFFYDKEGIYYQIRETDFHVIVCYAKNPDEYMKTLIAFEKIYPEQNLYQIIIMGMQRYFEEGQTFLDYYNSMKGMSSYVHGTLLTEPGENELQNLCQVYANAVRAGNGVMDFAEVCKDTLRIHSLKAENYANPYLFTLLKKIPDTYYDFIVGMERNISQTNQSEERYIHFLETYPESTTTDMIIFCSMLNVNRKLTDRLIKMVIDHVNEDETFAIYGGKHGENEVPQCDIKHDWHIFTKIIDGIGYTFRQVKGLVLVDYMYSCICAVFARSYPKNSALLIHVVEDVDRRPGVDEAVCTYLIEQIRTTKCDRVIVKALLEEVPYFEKFNFEILDEIPGPDPYPIDRRTRVYMAKNLKITK